MRADAPHTSVTLFIKSPTPGTVKTRLAASIGVDAATAFYVACAEHAVKAVVGVAGAAITVAFSPRGAEAAVRTWLEPLVRGHDVAFEPQAEDGDLGVRMQAALARGLEACAKVKK